MDRFGDNMPRRAELKHKVTALAVASVLLFGGSVGAANAHASVLEPPSPGPGAAITPPAAPSCPISDCNSDLLALINRDRKAHHRRPLSFDRVQSYGLGECVGSRGKAAALARTGSLWHSSLKHPRASFPVNLCGGYSVGGENLGLAGGDRRSALLTIHTQMMGEGSRGGHYQNLMDAKFTRVGLWTTNRNGLWYVVEDFLG